VPKIAFIGAGSAVFTRNLLGDLLTYPELDGSTISLMDIDANRLKAVESLAKKMVEQEGSKMVIEATTDRSQALQNADYVVITIQVGGLKAYELDIEIPRKYGVEQCVGDTIGPGGVFRGLRHLAVIEEICNDLEELSPDALILQYTNPMAILCWGISSMSSIRFVGLCHSVQGTSEELAHIAGVPYEELSYWVAGINHMSWFLRLEHKGRDLYPLLFEKMSDPDTYALDPIRFDLMKHFGYFVTESSGHASEYYPYFRKRQDVLEQTLAKFTHPRHGWFKFGQTGGYLKHCFEVADHYYEDIEDQLKADKIEIRRSREYGAQIIHSIETNTPRRINGNVTNYDLITNLPYGCCVEVPCLVDNTGINPCYVGDLPPQLAGLIRTNVNLQELAVLGHIHRDKTLVKQAIKMDPLTAAVCSLEEIDNMVHELFDAQKEWLPQFD